MRFEIAANRWRFESLRTACRDSSSPWKTQGNTQKASLSDSALPKERLQRRRDDNKNKICAFRGGGPWGQRGKSSQNAVFRGKRHHNKILKVQILLSRNFVVVAQAPTLRIFSGYFQPFGLFPFCKVVFGDPPKIPFKTSVKLTSLGLF